MITFEMLINEIIDKGWESLYMFSKTYKLKNHEVSNLLYECKTNNPELYKSLPEAIVYDVPPDDFIKDMYELSNKALSVKYGVDISFVTSIKWVYKACYPFKQNISENIDITIDEFFDYLNTNKWGTLSKFAEEYNVNREWIRQIKQNLLKKYPELEKKNPRLYDNATYISPEDLSHKLYVEKKSLPEIARELSDDTKTNDTISKHLRALKKKYSEEYPELFPEQKGTIVTTVVMSEKMKLNIDEIIRKEGVKRSKLYQMFVTDFLNNPTEISVKYLSHGEQELFSQFEERDIYHSVRLSKVLAEKIDEFINQQLSEKNRKYSRPSVLLQAFENGLLNYKK